MPTVPTPFRYRFAAWGDLNAFFGLLLDNVTNLVLLAGLLVGAFGYPAEVFFARMVPGTALGVLAGDLLYTWMAFRLARRTGRHDITAMPLGLDTPSTIGMATAVLGPCYLQTRDPILTWQVGMATMMFMGVLKTVLAFSGDAIRRLIPRAGLLGSIGGIGLTLLGFLPLLHIFETAYVGLVALGLVLYTLVARLPLPGRLPGAFAAVAVGVVLYHGLGTAGWLGHAYAPPALGFRLDWPLPTLAFADGVPLALGYLPVAIPFGLLTVVGGINVTESARVAGDPYRTRDVLLTEAVATLIAGFTGGVAQSTPYIGHPAYKLMGARAAYTLATGLVFGLGGCLGVLTSLIQLLPPAVVAPILVFIGLEIATQAFQATPRRHLPAAVFACLPMVAEVGRILVVTFVSDPTLAQVQLSAAGAERLTLIRTLAHGFILTGMLWGAYLATLIDRRTTRAAVYALFLAGFAAVGLVHSVRPDGGLYAPGAAPDPLADQVALGYLAVAFLTFALGFGGRGRAGAAAPPAEDG